MESDFQTILSIWGPWINFLPQDINLWYAHALICVWLVTCVPKNVVAYSERGWPCFEQAISSMLTPSWQLLDLGHLQEAGMDADYGVVERRDQCDANGRVTKCFCTHVFPSDIIYGNFSFVSHVPNI